MTANTDYPAYHDAKLNWDDLAWLKDLAKGTPIYLKGVCHIDVSSRRALWPESTWVAPKGPLTDTGCQEGQGVRAGRMHLVESRELPRL